jgi:hypothetical protein
MYDFLEIYRWYERIVGILVLAILALYLMRCVTTGGLLSLGQFGDYVRGLFTYLFR